MSARDTKERKHGTIGAGYLIKCGTSVYYLTTSQILMKWRKCCIEDTSKTLDNKIFPCKIDLASPVGDLSPVSLAFFWSRLGASISLKLLTHQEYESYM